MIYVGDTEIYDVNTGTPLVALGPQYVFPTITGLTVQNTGTNINAPASYGYKLLNYDLTMSNGITYDDKEQPYMFLDGKIIIKIDYQDNDTGWLLNILDPALPDDKPLEWSNNKDSEGYQLEQQLSNIGWKNRSTAIGPARTAKLRWKYTDSYGNKAYTSEYTITQAENKIVSTTHGIDMQYDYPLKGCTLQTIPWDYSSNIENYKDKDKMTQFGTNQSYWVADEIILAVGNWDNYSSGASKAQDAFTSNSGTLTFPDGRPDWVTGVDNAWNIYITDNNTTESRSVKIQATVGDETYTNTITQLGKPQNTK